MAKARAKPKDDLEELEDLEDLEDETEEEEPDDEPDEDEDEEEDDEDEDVAPKKSSKKKTKKRDDDKIGTSELAEALGTSGRELRVMLRQHEVEKNENNRYEWDSVDEALSDMGFKSIKSAQKALADSRAKRLTELKDKVAASKSTKKKATSKKSSSKKSAPVEDDEDEDEDDE